MPGVYVFFNGRKTHGKSFVDRFLCVAIFYAILLNKLMQFVLARPLNLAAISDFLHLPGVF